MPTDHTEAVILSEGVLIGGVRYRLVAQATPCEADILDLVRLTPRRLTVVQIIDALETSGKLHGESTVRHALARLSRSGRLVPHRRAPCGYSLPAAENLDT